MSLHRDAIVELGGEQVAGGKNRRAVIDVDRTALKSYLSMVGARSFAYMT
jgi:hypothetical protein